MRLRSAACGRADVSGQQRNAHNSPVDPQTTPGVTYTWESSPRSACNFDRLTTMSYPARPEGGDPRTLTFHYGNDPAGIDNALGRVTMISEPGSPLVEHARYHYAGTGRRISVMRWNNVGNSVVDLGGTGYTGLDRHGRLIDLHFKLAQDTVHRYQHTYDKAGNP